MTTPLDSTPKQPFWAGMVAKYQQSYRWKSIWQLCDSFLPFIACWYLMLLSIDISYWLTLLLALPTAGFSIRIFIIQHDCGHGSFFQSRTANDLWGMAGSLFSFIPYHYWRKSHSIHHASASKLEQRGIGDIYTMTVEEFLQLSRWGKLKYRLYRNPLILFVLVPPILFTLLYRFPVSRSESLKRVEPSIHLTTLAIAALFGGVIWLVGWKSFLMVQVPITLISSWSGMWLFYVQHQFEDTYWTNRSEWDMTLSALHGSSYYKLPKVLQWFTGNIGFHHVHHLSPRIPNYLLERCHRENEPLQKAVVLTLGSSLRSIRLRLWDEQQKKLVSFYHLKKRQSEAVRG